MGYSLASLWKKSARCALAAVLLVVLAWPAMPQQAVAADEAAVVAGNGTAVGTATLQIVGGLGLDGSPNVWLSKSYPFAEGATFMDLLDAAKAAGDIKGYEPNERGGVKSITKADGTTLVESSSPVLYWANYDNGAYASVTVEKDVLADGKSYQLAWSSYPTAAAPSDWSAIPVDTSLTGEKANSGTSTDSAAGTSTSEGTEQGKTASDVPLKAADLSKVKTLRDNLANRFVASSTRANDNGDLDKSLANNRYEAAIALNTLGRGGEIDVAAVLAKMDEGTNEEKAKTAGRMAKYIAILTNAGVDCTAVDDNGTTRNLVQEMEQFEQGATVSVYDAVCILPVYGYDGYKPGKNALSEDALVKAITSAQDASSGLVGSGGFYDSQTTAQAILALLPYKNDKNAEIAEDAARAIEMAARGIAAMQLDDGGIALQPGDISSNIEATAEAVSALSALGKDANGEELKSKTGATPVSYLLDQADETLDGYTKNSSYDEQLTSSTVLLALTAYTSAMDAAANMNVMTVHEVTPAADNDEASGSDSSDAVPASDGSASTMPQTGDAFPVALVAVLLAAGVAGGVARAKARRA